MEKTSFTFFNCITFYKNPFTSKNFYNKLKKVIIFTYHKKLKKKNL